VRPGKLALQRGAVRDGARLCVSARASGTSDAGLSRGNSRGRCRHPRPADLAYQGLIGSHQDALETFLGQRTETASLEAGQRRRLASAFLSRLVGIDIFRVLLGLPGTSEEERRDRAEAATAEFMAALPAPR
jgi:TetR/AcrR family transcriptional repressor of mexJK operon